MPPTDPTWQETPPTPTPSSTASDSPATPVPTAAETGDPTAAAAVETPPAPTPAQPVSDAPPAAATAAPAASSTSLPDVGALVRYDAVDTVTDAPLQGIGVIVDAFTSGDVNRVSIAQLQPTLFLDAEDVEAL